MCTRNLSRRSPSNHPNAGDQLNLTNLTNSGNWLTMQCNGVVMALKRLAKTAKKAPKRAQVNLYEAKTQLSSLVERAANGEEIVIAKANRPMARLVSIAANKNSREAEPLPFGKNLLGITFIADDFDDDLPPELFEEGESDHLLRSEGAK